ncbi:Uncharacterised protein [Legionella busanensis]|uniref:Uncharacterized protein n=1 Tax=Legionella busanensis TaxID=190655 RepID=A0A378JJP0_9GAMM|nr:hypothetical protein [Legionella busanensis]STX50908.1 Uncharacterised protein [Legionella busanensis]
MPQISSLIKQDLLTSQNLNRELICALATKWPNELKRLCQPMQNSPSILHELVNILEDDLPSSILLQNGLLFDERGQIQTKPAYDRKDYVELNRGLSAAVALFYILRGDCYEKLVEGQKREIMLSRESYLQLHDQFKSVFLKNEIFDEQLLDTMFYAVLFNDLGKNIELKRILHDNYQVKENDHDLILRHLFQIEGLLEDFCQLNPSQQRCLRALWHSGFNPSSFDTLEYPLSMVVHWVMSFTNIAKENSSLYLAMKKIEILADIAGVNGNNAKGAVNLTEPVIKKFNKSFVILSQLFIAYQQQLDAGEKDNSLIYKTLIRKLEELLLEQAKSLGITASDKLLPRTVLVLRLCKMLGISDQTQTDIVDSVLRKIEQQNPDNYQILEQEFSWVYNPSKPILWMECIPKFLWLMSNGSNYDLLAKDSEQNSAIRKENGLYAGLLIVSNILKKVRGENRYEELYTFEGDELIRVSPEVAKLRAEESPIALLVAYDLVRTAQQASQLNSNEKTRQEAIKSLQDLWKQGIIIEGRSIKIDQTLETKMIAKTPSFFSSYQVPKEYLAKYQHEWLELISRETDEHCTYLASVGWADRAKYFKVAPFIYQDFIAKDIDISRFNYNMALPNIVRAFNPSEKNTLFANSESSSQDQEQEIKRALDIRLYPTIRRIIGEKATTVFLGSKVELQAYTESVKEKILIEIEVPSSVKFYLALNNAGELKVYISNLVSHENLIQQLITLKIAGIDLQKIPILGNTEQYKLICKEDLLAFEKQASTYLAKKNILIIAGCSLEDTVSSSLEQMFNGKISKNKFSGHLVSLSYIQSQHAPHVGFIVLNLNYGEICEEQISIILEKFNCIGVFSGSAAGYIPKVSAEKLPEIGDRIAIRSAKHYSGELVKLDENNTNLHLHVPTIFVETFNWLKEAKDLKASTVDVETFYILRAVQRYKQANPLAKLHTDIGVFISDYVGEKPLRSYHNVFAQYPLILQNFVEQVLIANITSSYNNNRSSIPTFANQYFAIEPEAIMINQSMRREAVVDSIGKFWDKSEFSKRVHTPVTIGTVKNQERFAKPEVPRCLHLPIKLPGSDIRIPIEYQHFADELQQIFNFEASLNKGWNDLYAYLTVDQGFVPRSNSQRVPGPHVDGIPRDRENPEAQLIDHAYLVTDSIPTMFYTQQFDMTPYDPKIHHFFAIFRALADESRTITVKPFEIALMNAYSVHTPTQTLEDVNRTFIRLEFSTLKFDRLGNSINPHFVNDSRFPDYPFNYIPRPIPSHLFITPDVYLNKPITNEDYSHESIDSFGRANLRAIFIQSDKFKFKYSDYKNLDLIAKNIMNEEMSGIIITYHGIPHAFCLYKIENKTVKLDTLFTLMSGKGQELMIYEMKILKKFADRLSIQAGLEEGAIPVTINVNENNNDMLRYFLRAARLAKIEVNIERLVSEPLVENNLSISIN